MEKLIYEKKFKKKEKKNSETINITILNFNIILI